MIKAKVEIIAEMSRYLKNRGILSYWYTGVASDPRQRLFLDHNVPQSGGNGWIYRECENAAIAREVVDHLIKNLGTDGEYGDGDDSARYVYAYRKTARTRESVNARQP